MCSFSLFRLSIPRSVKSSRSSINHCVARHLLKLKGWGHCRAREGFSKTTFARIETGLTHLDMERGA